MWWVMLLLILETPYGAESSNIREIRVVPGLYRTEANCLNQTLKMQQKYPNVGFDCIVVDRGFND